MIYLDNAASTKVDEKVLKEMIPYFSTDYANPSSEHKFGKKISNVVLECKARIGKILGCRPDEIFFTSCGTESNNWVINSFDKIITSEVEHKSIIEPAKQKNAVFLKPDNFGRISIKQVEKVLTEETELVSIIYGNNEIGTVNDIREIAAAVKKKGKLFHVDSCQCGMLDLNVRPHIDLMTLNGSKINGPKGIGILYASLEAQDSLKPLLIGGGQQEGFRSGTLNVPGIVGFTKALELSQKIDKEKLYFLRKFFVEQTKNLGGQINGHPTEVLPHIISVSFPGKEALHLLQKLEENNIIASAGSACTSKTIEPNHVLKAIGLNNSASKGTIRFSLGKNTTKEELSKVVELLGKVLL
ncbi:cysteine desulfurase [Candidatus Woesearchaeota archaeon]|nr:cysteine desulfurase [Candidatus Woesearchaeota archaeon]